MKIRANLMNAEEMSRALKRISHQILERNQGAENIVLLGIRSRGLPLAKLLADNIQAIEGVQAVSYTHLIAWVSASIPVEAVTPFGASFIAIGSTIAATGFINSLEIEAFFKVL